MDVIDVAALVLGFVAGWLGACLYYDRPCSIIDAFLGIGDAVKRPRKPSG